MPLRSLLGTLGLLFGDFPSALGLMLGQGVGQMQWMILRHWAELALSVAVLHMFQTCHGLGDAFKVITEADDITRLGVVTALAIALNGLAGMLTALAQALRLAELVRRLRSLWRGRGR